jgi:hypothetical protein
MKNEKAPEKETHTSDEKENIPVEAKAKTESAIESLPSFRFWREFDRAFDRFRRDFEELLWPSGRILERAYAMLPVTTGTVAVHRHRRPRKGLSLDG